MKLGNMDLYIFLFHQCMMLVIHSFNVSVYCNKINRLSLFTLPCQNNFINLTLQKLYPCLASISFMSIVTPQRFVSRIKKAVLYERNGALRNLAKLFFCDVQQIYRQSQNKKNLPSIKTKFLDHFNKKINAYLYCSSEKNHFMYFECNVML